jgi:hypothetical protein
MDKPDTEKQLTLEKTPDISLKDVLTSADELVKHLISLSRLDDETQIDPDILMKGELFEEHRLQQAKWASHLYRGIHMSLRRYGPERNTHSELTIHFYPHPDEIFTVFSDIERGLTNEWVIKHKPSTYFASEKVRQYLKSHSNTEIDFISLKIAYSGEKGQEPDTVESSLPIAVHISMNMADGSIISFDPMVAYHDLIEERGAYSRTAYDRILRTINQIISRDELSILGKLINMALTESIANESEEIPDIQVPQKTILN